MEEKKLTDSQISSIKNRVAERLEAIISFTQKEDLKKACSVVRKAIHNELPQIDTDDEVYKKITDKKGRFRGCPYDEISSAYELQTIFNCSKDTEKSFDILETLFIFNSPKDKIKVDKATAIYLYPQIEQLAKKSLKRFLETDSQYNKGLQFTSMFRSLSEPQSISKGGRQNYLN